MGSYASPVDMPVSASVVSSAEEIAMPSFLDALEASAPLEEPIQTNGDDSGVDDASSAKSWY